MMRVWSVLVICVQLVLLLHMSDAADTTCVQNEEMDFRPDRLDCAVFHRCVGEELYKFNCWPDTVFNAKEKVCVHKGSSDDTCTSQNYQTSSDTLIPHASRCSLYYNYSALAKRFYWENHLQECDQPQVYNTVTRRCEHYSMVDCGEREMPLGFCDYKINQCFRKGNCRPCLVDNPTCRNLDDGLHPEFPNTENTSNFVVCKDQRLVYQGQCIKFDGREQIFDPVTKSCVLV